MLVSKSAILVNNPSILVKSTDCEGNCSVGNGTVGVNILSTYIKYFPDSSTEIVL